jgi:hypothetical protein
VGDVEASLPDRGDFGGQQQRGKAAGRVLDQDEHDGPAVDAR